MAFWTSIIYPELRKGILGSRVGGCHIWRCYVIATMITHQVFQDVRICMLR